MAAKVKKIVAYVTRTHQGKMQLLVFTHPKELEAGLQVPAGTIKESEEPATACLREVFEETGLTQVQIIRKLGVFDYFNPFTNLLNERHVFHLISTAETPDAWEWLETGGGEVPDDERHLFAFYWADLDAPIELAGSQGDYLTALE